MATYRDLIYAALTEIGVLAAGETAPAADGTLGLAALNRLIDMWAAQRLQIYEQTRTTWTITASDGTYTVGTGGNVSRARPAFIDHVFYQDTSTSPDTEYQMNPLTDDAYASIVQKDLTSPLPQAWWYQAGYPLGTIYLWPVPTSSTLQGVMYAPTSVTEVSSLSDSVSLPPGYRQMIVKNLALELAPSYDVQPNELIFRQATEATSTVKRLNKRLLDMSFDSAALIQDSTWRWDINVGP